MKHLWLLALVASMATAQPPTDDLSLRRTPLTVPARFDSLYAGIDSVLLPPGFSIEVFAAGLQQPRFMALSAMNVLHVAEMEAHRIVALPDRDGDGVSDTVINVATVDSAHSLAFYDGAMYVATPTTVLRLRDLDTDGIYETRETLIDNISNTGTYNHFTRTIAIDSAGKCIYLGVGASCNVCREEHVERGAILRFDIDGTNREIFATGLRNPIGVTVDPNNGQVWATNADRDWLGDDIPPEIITHVARGSFHGWPFAYGDHKYIDFNNSAPEYPALLPVTAADSARVASMQVADITIAAHSTPMAIAFVPHQKFPPDWAGSALVAVHGSSGGGRPGGAVGYNVVRISPLGFAGWSVGTFLSGFLTDTSNYKYWGRPCGLAIAADGTIYLSSDRGIGAVYRITYHDTASSVRISESASPHDLHAIPNPSRSGVTLSYAIDGAANVAIRLYDVAGHLVGSRGPVVQSAGQQRMLFGGTLPAGVYFATIAVDGIDREHCSFVVYADGVR